MRTARCEVVSIYAVAITTYVIVKNPVCRAGWRMGNMRQLPAADRAYRSTPSPSRYT